jgi:multicomponent Na+:H+ antiporter subunit D
MNVVLALPIIVPLFGAALAIVFRHLIIQRIISFISLTVSLVSATIITIDVSRDTNIAVSRLGGWPANIAITLVADRLAAMLLFISVSLLVIVLGFAIGQRSVDEHSPIYHPVYLILATGISQAFLAGDLFNLFVAFELMLMASYVLLTLDGTDKQIKSGVTYVVLNVLKSLLLLTAVGLIFAATGTVNLSELPELLAALPESVRTGLNLLLLVAFGIKAAVFPLYFWLPDSYPTAPSSVTAVFAGLLTKVGVYGIIRTETLLFPGNQANLLIWIAAFTMVAGVIGALAQTQMKRILSFHIVSQIGYIVMGIALGTKVALAATVFYLMHHIPVKASLFLVEGIVERETGETEFDKVGGLARRSGFFAVLFMIPALSLAGIPPFSGFLAKYSLIRAGFDDGQWVIIGIAIAVSLLTLISMTKIWIGLFWGEIMPPVPTERIGILRHHQLMTFSTVVLIGGTLVVALMAGPLYEFCVGAAEQLFDPMMYVKAVRGS